MSPRPASLKDIERQIAWFYAAAVRAATSKSRRAHAERDERLLRRVLRTSEAFTASIGWLHEVKPNPDEILDLAVILTRALDYWNEARARWQAEATHVALCTAAAELAHAADALQDAITGSPWIGTSAVSSIEMHGLWPRKIQ